ncbi:hypothetical protein HCI99_16985 [Listeria booriae]|uniref:Uncharacterized protein n=1 Tax=Listeria booriae TaxID=1552123 RepID=A0A7X0XGF6_9LIST|nr:hypothetical protein [Listeria booriae]MBC1493513.1 hypothetical protein [Listeria booriae]
MERVNGIVCHSMVSMELDETPDLMDAINERTAYVAELHPSMDFIVISKG